VKKSASARQSGQDIAEPTHEPRDKALPSRADVLAFIAGEREAFGEKTRGKIGNREIARAFNVKGPARIALKRMLKDLEGDGAIERRRKGLHKPGGPLQGTVLADMNARDRDGELLRAKTQVLGIFRADPRGGGRIVPIDKKNVNRDELGVGPGDEGIACDGDLVAVEVLRTGRLGLPSAKIRERLGAIGNERATSLIAIHAHQIPHVFSPEVIAEVERARPATMVHREDWRAIPLVAIDPADAKDHDDAVHAERDPDPSNPDGFILRIAIADVAAYVRPGGALDREAQDRGNSVYFPDRVVPMLPERISNDLCSLRPNEDRPALAARIVVAADGHKLSHSFHRVMMRSAARLAYPQTQALIDHGPDEATRSLRASVLVPLYEAYAALKMAREKRGPLDLDVPERKIILDEKGAVKSIATPPRLDSHRLIEEFMILANVAAAEALEAKHQALIYRVHDEPPLEKLNNLCEFLASIGIKPGKGQVLRAAQFNRILARVKGTDDEHLVNEIVLRTQAQAEYAIENYSHFGLNLRRYAHFTSPIRRYADLITHRALISALHLGTDGLGSIAQEELAAIAAKISAAERRAMAAERETSERLIAAHLAGQIGVVFQGRISGATSAGLFVKLDETGADGFIPAAMLGDDYFRHDQARHALIGSRTGQIHRLGDIVTVRLVEAAPLAGALRFELVSETAPRQARPRPAKAKRSPRRDIRPDFGSPQVQRAARGAANR
jgi:ribonuclease R